MAYKQTAAISNQSACKLYVLAILGCKNLQDGKCQTVPLILETSDRSQFTAAIVDIRGLSTDTESLAEPEHY